MNPDFPRILTLLRKEKGISQKEAANALKVSQALLSHYEKGIRECGLDFLVRTAEFYNVSADYLLGLSPERSGQKILVEEIPEAEAGGKDNNFKGGILPTLNKKLITNSLNILFDLMAKTNNKTVINEISSFLMLAVYRMFRVVYSINPKNEETIFTVNKTVANARAHAQMILHEANASAVSAGANVKDLQPIHNRSELSITTESLHKDYPLFASSLFNLIQNSENDLN